MDPIAQTAAAILERSPAPALTLDELREALARESPQLATRPERLLGALARHSDIRILRRPPCEGEAEIGPTAWVMATGCEHRTEHAVRSIPERLRRSVISVGEAIQQGSMRDWARWNLLLAEEGRARDALRRSAREGARRAPPPTHLSSAGPPKPPSRRRRRRRPVST